MSTDKNRAVLKDLLSGTITAAQARERLRQKKTIVPTVIDWGDGTYSMGGTSGMSEAQVLEATGAERIEEVIAISFTSGQNGD